MPSRVPTHRPRRLATPSADRHREYDRLARDPEAKRFYDSAAWQQLRRWKLATHPLCERCKSNGLVVAASHVHHKVERGDAPELALDEGNLESLCHPCHSRHHASGPDSARAPRGGRVAATASTPPTARGHARVF